METEAYSGYSTQTSESFEQRNFAHSEVFFNNNLQPKHKYNNKKG
jgi:hypothetical protein